jgi:hypothetical protein
MANLGPNSLLQIALPTYWDAATLEQLRLASGETYASWVADIQAALSIGTADVFSDSLNTSLISITEEAAREEAVGASNGFQAATEYGEPDVKRGATAGNMLPLDSFDRGLGWTARALEDARRATLDADVGSAIQDLKNIWQQTILRRLFKSTYTAVGSSGRSMPLADAGTADSAYVPLSRPDRSPVFTSSHDHIHHYAAISQANLDTVTKHLWEHGYDGPFELLVAFADLGTWTNVTTMTGYVPPARQLIRYGSTVDVAQVDPAGFIGVIDTPSGECRLRVTGRLATTYWAVWKSYGPLDPRNPLVVRVKAGVGTQAMLKPSETRYLNPLQFAKIEVRFGVGVANRVGAYVAKIDGAAYSDPTVS